MQKVEFAKFPGPVIVTTKCVRLTVCLRYVGWKVIRWSDHAAVFAPSYIHIRTLNAPIQPTHHPINSCLIEPLQAYKDRIYTRGVVGWHGVKVRP